MYELFEKLRRYIACVDEKKETSTLCKLEAVIRMLRLVETEQAWFPYFE